MGKYFTLTKLPSVMSLSLFFLTSRTQSSNILGGPYQVGGSGKVAPCPPPPLGGPMRNLSHKIGIAFQPIFVSKKLEQDLKPREINPPIINQQCVVYLFPCDLCDSDYVDYTTRHLHQRVFKHKSSVISKHFIEPHGDINLFKLILLHVIHSSFYINYKYTTTLLPT